MAAELAGRTTISVTTTAKPSETIIAGFSAYGLAGLTAADYLVSQLGLEQTGYITIDALPTITPSLMEHLVTTRAYFPDPISM